MSLHSLNALAERGIEVHIHTEWSSTFDTDSKTHYKLMWHISFIDASPGRRVEGTGRGLNIQEALAEAMANFDPTLAADFAAHQGG